MKNFINTIEFFGMTMLFTLRLLLAATAAVPGGEVC